MLHLLAGPSEKLNIKIGRLDRISLERTILVEKASLPTLPAILPQANNYEVTLATSPDKLIRERMQYRRNIELAQSHI